MVKDLRSDSIDKNHKNILTFTMNNKLSNSVRDISQAFYENPDLIKEPNIAQLFGAINLVGGAKALDMIKEVEHKKII